MADPLLQKSHAELQKTTQTVQANAEQVKSSAHRIEDSAHSIQKTTDRATELAADRTLLARLVPDPLVMLAASVLVLFSAFCFCAAVWRQMVPRSTNPNPDAPRIPRAILFLVNGSLTLVALGALVGIWISRLSR